MRNVLAVLLMAATISLLHGQNVVVDVPAPTATPINMGMHRMGEWIGGSFLPCPAGDWQIQNATVNPDQTLGPLSDPKLMQLPAGWMLAGSARNLSYKRAAVAWVATHVSTGRQIWLRQGVADGPHSWWFFGGPGLAGYPWSGNSNYPYILVPTNLPWGQAPVFRTLATNQFALKQTSTSADAIVTPIPPPPAPDVWLVSAPLGEVKVRRTWVTHAGETQPGPVGVLPAMVGQESAGGMRRVSFVHLSANGYMQTEQPPEGVLGHYLYMEIGGEWKRQLTLPWLEGTAGNDKYLRPVYDNQPVIWSAHDGPAPSPTARPCSVVTPLQRAAYAGDSYTSPAQVEDLYGPVIIGYAPSKPTQAIGGLAGWRLVHRHNVPPTDGVTFPNDHPTYWPAFCTMNSEPQMTTVRSAKISYEAPEHNAGRGPGLSATFTGVDYSGGQAFKFCAENCFSKVDEYNWRWPRHDVYVNVEQQGIYGHSPSEWKFTNCSMQKAKVYSGQSINFLFDKCHITKIDIGGTLVRCKELIMPGGDQSTLFSFGDNAGIDVDGLFVDVPCYSLFDCDGSQTRELRVRNITSVCGFQYFVRSPMNQQKHKVKLEGWGYWRPGNEPGWLYSGWRNVLDVETTGSDVLKGRLTPSQPVLPYGNP